MAESSRLDSAIQACFGTWPRSGSSVLAGGGQTRCRRCGWGHGSYGPSMRLNGGRGRQQRTRLGNPTQAGTVECSDQSPHSGGSTASGAARLLRTLSSGHGITVGPPVARRPPLIMWSYCRSSSKSSRACGLNSTLLASRHFGRGELGNLLPYRKGWPETCSPTTASAAKVG